MPTQEEWNNLLSATTNEWLTVNGVYGRKFTSKTDSNKYIFIPAAGDASGSSVDYVGSYGYVWSSSLITSDPVRARYLYFGGSYSRMNYYGRYHGFSVRGVRR